jgi:hypothetical protein
MSRLTSMSPEAIRAVFSTDMDSDLIFLLTIYDPITNAVSVRLADNYTQRLTAAPYAETETEVFYGVVSRTEQYLFLPLELSLPSEEEAQAPRCSLVIRDVTRNVTPLIRSISGPPKVTMELVLSKTPDVVEASFAGFYITSFVYNADSVTAELAMIDYEREPFPMHAFTAPYFPGLF